MDEFEKRRNMALMERGLELLNSDRWADRHLGRALLRRVCELEIKRLDWKEAEMRHGR